LDDLFGFLMAVVFIGLTIMGRVNRGRNGQEQPQPGVPRPAPPPRPATMNRPNWPPPASPQTTWPPLDEEGPEEEEQVEREVERFNRETDQMGRREMEGVTRFAQERAEFEGRNLSQLRSSLGQGEAAAEVTKSETGIAPELQADLANPQSAARAIILAEVLGQPKGRRGHRRF